MSESKDSMKNNNEQILKEPPYEELSSTYKMIFQILLIIQIIILFVIFVFFGLNHLVLFVASITVTIRMFLGVKNKRPNYFIKGLFLFVWCFVGHVVKIIFRYILTYFIFKNRDGISNLKDMNIIETNNILWIKSFDIKINGLWSIIIIIIFMIFWLILIILFELKKKHFDYIDNTDNETYINLINEYHQKHQSDENENGQKVELNIIN